MDAVSTNLPLQLTSFIGREREIAEVKRLLGATRLLTLTGAGGSGKTRLALQVATDLAGEYADGAWFVDLAPLADSALVPQVSASVFDVRETPGSPLTETLINYLRTKNMLLLLDNCEHLIVACAQFAKTLLSACPNLRIVATSREALNVAGETAFRVPSLALPDPQQLPPLETLAHVESVRLFIERACAAQHDFQLMNVNAPAIVQICHRLDGMPLAIELAAAQVRALSVEQIAARLDDRFRLLTRGGRTALPRQQTLRAAIDWSHDLLSERERVLFRRLAVFVGGFNIESAEAICSNAEMAPRQVFEVITELVDKSILVADTTGRAEARYHMLETIRQYAFEKLLGSGEAKTIRSRHLDFYLTHVGKYNPGRYLEAGASYLAWLNWANPELDNLRAALDWCEMESALLEQGEQLTIALGEIWEARGYLSEGRERCKRMITRTETGRQTTLRADVLTVAGRLAMFQGDYSLARPFLEESVKILSATEDKPNLARALVNLAIVVQSQGDYPLASSLSEQILEIQKASGDKRRIALALNRIGEVERARGNYAEAQTRYNESLALLRTVDDPLDTATVLGNLGFVAQHQGEYARAAAFFVESLSLSRSMGYKLFIVTELAGFAGTVLSMGELLRAAKLFGASEAQLNSMGAVLYSADRADYERNLAVARTHLHDETFAAAWAEGRAMSLEQAIEYALAEQVAVPLPMVTPPHDPNVLTPREVEVLRWVAAGLSNAQVAGKLVISPRTVNTHLNSIYSKLGVNSRSAVTRYALDRKLV